MFIIYASVDEVIVCTTETEDATLKLYFTEGGRHMENYDRYDPHESDPAVAISARLAVN